MKLILFVAVVMFKCSRLSSAPADLSAESLSKNNSENEFALNQPNYGEGHQPGLAYVSDSDDLGSNGVVFQFRRSIKSDNTEIEARRRSALDKGFMRFGRGGNNIVRFGRSSNDDEQNFDDEIPEKVRKNDKNLLRFGRAGYMRFGRDFIDDSTPEDYNDASEIDDFVERPVLRSNDNRYAEHGNKILRLGRSSSESASNEAPVVVQPSPPQQSSNKKSTDKNMLRFGRAGNMMRFGRGNMLRFGRGNVMRFGKRGNMMRFGRGGNQQEPTMKIFKLPSSFMQSRSTRAKTNDRNYLRLGRAGNLIRFGRNDKNVMRFGKRSGPEAVSSSTKIYCEDDDCLVQENENQLMENDDKSGDQLQELFGGESSKQGYGEYIIEK